MRERGGERKRGRFIVRLAPFTISFVIFNTRYCESRKDCMSCYHTMQGPSILAALQHWASNNVLAIRSEQQMSLDKNLYERTLAERCQPM